MQRNEKGMKKEAQKTFFRSLCSFFQLFCNAPFKTVLNQPFTAPAVMPSTNILFRQAKRIIIGMIASKVPAIIRLY